MSTLIKNILKFSLFLGIGLVILYLVYQKADASFQDDCRLKGISPDDCSLVNKVITDFQGANYFWIVLTIVLFTISNLSRAIRWKMLIVPLGYNPKLVNCFWSVAFGYFANLGLPRMGEIMRAGLLAQYEKISVEKVMGTIVISRIVDVISLLIMTALAFLIAFNKIWPFFNEYVNLNDKLSNRTNLVIITGTLALAFGITFYFLRPRLLKSRLFQKLQSILLGFVDGLKTIGKLKSPFWFLFHSINIWIMYYLMIYLCFFAYEPTAGLSAAAGLVIFVMGGWGMVIPSPGGMGTYHFMVQTGLAMYSISWDDGFSFANIAFFSIQLGANVLLGILALILMPMINKNYIPVVPATQDQ